MLKNDEIISILPACLHVLKSPLSPVTIIEGIIIGLITYLIIKNLHRLKSWYASAMTLFKRLFHYCFPKLYERDELRKQIQKSKATLARVKKAIDTYNQDPPYGVPVKVDVDWDDLLRADKYRFRIKDLFSCGKKVEAECKELRKQNKKLEAGTARIKSLVHVHNVRPHYGNDFVIDWDSM